jgi:5-amino-6-(5-phosphoribosylamino)uracil reductase/diaminohydroxyphosphoribosylaminopyrimidine deaminase/5-amino-6-(5-phosphoribosylamino)uracil reductase
VLVGVGTILADNPELTVRLCAGPDPLKIIVDSTLRTPATASVLTSGTARALIATTIAAPEERARALQEAGAQILQCGSIDGRVDLGAMLQQLRMLGIRSVLIEGGAEIITSMLRSRLADRMVIVTAPKLIGTGLAAIGDLGIERVSAALSFIDPMFETHGQDLVFSGTIDWPAE